MSHGFTDWQEVGIFPLQDHEEDVPSGMRLQLVGGRITRMVDPKDNANGEISAENLMITYADNSLGDIHPWFLWQTRDKEKRDSGSWAQGFPAIMSDAKAAGPGPTTGGDDLPGEVIPIGSRKYEGDERYIGFPDYTVTDGSTWPRSFPRPVRGQIGIVMPHVDEKTNGALWMPTDPRLVCVNAQGPAEAGTTVVDVQGGNELCIVGAERPGQGGRQAFLHSMMRVIAMPPDRSAGLYEADAFNGLAWNLDISTQDNVAGYGMCWGRVDVAGTGPTTGGGIPQGPITPGGGGPITPGGSVVATAALPGSGYGNSIGIDEAGENEDLGPSPDQFGRFFKVTRPGFGVGLASATAYGPFHVGHKDDKHSCGKDADGNTINSLHLHEFAFWYRNKEFDGPMLFEGRYPYPQRLPMHSVVHLSYDDTLTHPFFPQQPCKGMWRWWAEVPVVTPGSSPPVTFPQPPKPKGPTTGGPATPGPGKPATPGPGTPAPPPGGGPTTGGPSGPTAPGPSGPSPSGGPPLTQPTTPNPGGKRWPGLPPTTGAGRPLPWGYPTGPSGPLPVPWWGGPDKEDPDTGPGGPTTGSPGWTGPPSPGPSGPAEWWLEEQRKKEADRAKRREQWRVYDESFDHPAAPNPGYHQQVASAGSIAEVGQTTGESHANYVIHHPMMESFAGMAFRPQMWARGAPNFLHSPDHASELYYNDELFRPQVLAQNSWAAQAGSGEFAYLVDFGQSRARGGITNGGVLYNPPEFEMEDYLGINGDMDVDVPTTTSFVAAAPGVWFALGEPSADGGLTAASVTIGRSLAAANANKPMVIAQMNSSRVAQDMLTIELDRSSGERVVIAEGTTGFRIPSGTTAQRPTALVGAGLIRINTDGGNDALEFRDDAGGAWVTGLTDTITFTDNAAASHEVVIQGGLITAWTVTP